MRRFTIECYKPKGESHIFITHDCTGIAETVKAIFDLRLEGVERIKVFEMIDVTKEFIKGDDIHGFS